MTTDLEQKLCMGVDEDQDDFRKVEKVLAPFLRTIKKRKRVKADVLPQEHQELYMKRSPKELLEKLHSDFTDPLKFKTLLNETAELLKVVTKSKSMNLYLTDYEWNEILLCPKHIQNNDRFERRYTIGAGSYVASYVAWTKEYVISSDILGDVRFPQGIPFIGPSAKAVLCVPVIINVKEDCIGVIELYKDCSEESYNIVDLQICIALSAWMGTALHQNNEKWHVMREREIQNQISSLTELYFSGAISFPKIISDILKITKETLKAERGWVYVFHEPVQRHTEEVIFAEAYEEGVQEDEGFTLFKKANKVKFVKNEPGISGWAARSGDVINIHDAYKDSRFEKKLDPPFFRSRSVAVIPVKSGHGVLAVIKLTNCLEYPFFRKEEIDVVQSYTHFIAHICGYYLLDCSHHKLTLKHLITDKLLEFHMKPHPDDLNAVKTFSQSDQLPPPSFYKFDYDTTNFDEDAAKYMAIMLINADFLESCFEPHTLADFLLRVRKCCRPNLYHNFEHAFTSFHFTFNILNFNKDIFPLSEMVCMMLASLCHDVDHQGYTNSFLSLKNDISYQLYGEFCGEAHRYDVTLFLIQSSGLLSHITNDHYHSICKNLKRLMISFDLAINFRNRKTLVDLLNKELFDWDNPEHRYLLQNMILICADYSIHFKTFDVVKKCTPAFYKELYKQGDLEKSMGFSAVVMTDRNKLNTIPENQVILLTIICSPALEIIVHLLPNLSILTELLNDTLENWKDVMAMRGVEMWRIDRAIVKDKWDKKSNRVTLTSTLSSIRTIVSDS